MPADTPAPDAAAQSPSRSKTVAAGTRAPRATAAVPDTAGAAGARKKTTGTTTAKPAAKGGRAKPAITPSPGTDGAVLTAVPAPGAAPEAGEGLKLDETIVAGADGPENVPEGELAAAEEETAEGGDFEWDDEEESEALRQARKDANPVTCQCAFQIGSG